MDTHLAFFIHDHMPYWSTFKAFFRLMSWLGNSPIILLTIFTATLYFTLRGRLNKAHIMLLTGVIAFLSSTILKRIVHRPRPLLWEHLDKVGSFSFPSGHALVTTAVFGILAYFLGERFPLKRRLIYILTAILLFFIGFSRIYLGVHWPSDVLCGWLIGGGILYLMILWYRHGGIKRTLRIALGLIFLVFGIIGLIVPIIPGILLLIAAFFLIFSNRSFSDMLRKKKKELTPPLQ